MTQRLDDVVDSIRDELQLILMGSFEKPLSNKHFLNSIIASSRCRFGDDAKIEETVFELDEIKNIISGPVVIVYGVPPEEDTEKVKYNVYPV